MYAPSPIKVIFHFVHSPGDHLLLMLPDPLESRFVVSDDVGFDSTPAWAITSFNAFSSSSIFDPMSSIRPTIVSLSLLNRVCWGRFVSTSTKMKQKKRLEINSTLNLEG